MIGDLTNHLWQSTVFAVAAGLLTAALRHNRAAVRHCVWLTASMKFLVPFSLLMSLGSQLAWTTVSPETAPPAVPAISLAMEQISQPFSDVFSSTTTTPQTTGAWLPIIFAGVWACGFAAIAVTRVRGWRRLRAAVRTSTPVTIPGVDLRVRSSRGLLEPGVVGFWRPTLLVPSGIEDHLTPPQLQAVVAHELCHVHRRDNLTAAIHMIVEAVFWFHPLVWWIGARLVEERERACDEYVLRTLGEPQAYAEGIVSVCKLYVESPLVCVAGVTGSNLEKRIEAILINRIGLPLSNARRLLLGFAAVAAIALPLAAGIVTAPLRASAHAGASADRQSTALRPQFEVASIRPCEDSPGMPGGRSGGAGPRFSPGRFIFECGTVEMLVNAAYVANGEPLLNDEGRLGASRSDPTAAFPRRIRGGPAWVRTERYTIEAKAAISTGLPGRQAPERKTLMGPMLQVLLEERFQLRLHREIQDDIPMYALTVAKGGLKIKPVGADGGCTPPVPGQGLRMDEEIALVGRGGKPICGHGIMGGRNGPNHALVLNGQSMDGIAHWLSGMLARHVLNRTGVDGKFVMYLEYAPDDMTTLDLDAAGAAPVTEPPTAPSIATALQQLGLKLEAARGPKGYIVIDHVERPSPNSASAVPQTRPRSVVTPAMEAALKDDLFRMRAAIDRYHTDKGEYPASLTAMVMEGYLQRVPEDPITSVGEWRIVPAKPDPDNPSAPPRVFDVKSASEGVALDGTKYSDW